MDNPYPCPCCGHLVFAESPGSYEICPVCFWDDDSIQLRWPDYSGGANRPSLRESQLNVVRWGAMEERFAGAVRAARADEPIDEGWRPIADDQDSFEPPDVVERTWPEDLTTLYWWRPTFWRR